MKLTKSEIDLVNKERRRKKEKTLKAGELYFVLPDLHRPFHSNVLWNKILEAIKRLEPEGVLLSGDYIDLFTLGSYNADSLKNLQGINLEMEYADGRKGIQQLNKAIKPGARKMYLYGNHEDRYFREIEKKDNAKYGDALQNPTEALKLKESGWEVKENWRDDYFSIGDLDIVHGIFYNVHVAKKHLESHDGNIMFGHCHRVQEFTLGSKSGYAIGWLGDKKSNYFKYMPRLTRKNWRNAFSVVRVIDGVSYPDIIKINEDNNTFILEGELY